MASTPLRATDNNENTTGIHMAKLRKKLLRQNIKDLLLGFNFKELITDAIIGIFELDPAQVIERLNDLKLRSDKSSVASLLCNRSQTFSVQDLEEMYHLLLLYRTAFHSKRKKWMPVNLLEPEENMSFPTDEDVIRLNILQGLRIKGLNAVVKVVTYEDLIWVMVIEKKLTRRKGMKLLTPKFLCFEVGAPYIFTASKINKPTMEGLLRAMKYKNCKLQQLEGKDVKSLLSLLKNRSTNKNQSVVPYTQDKISAGNRYTDHSKKNSRENYVDKVFNSGDPINLDSFTVKADSVWRSSLVPEMQGEPFPVTMTLKSKNVVEMIKHMASIDMVSTPLPDYLLVMKRLAKNKVCIKSLPPPEG